MIFVESQEADLTAAEIDRAFEVAQNTGGWSYEEADLIARALVQTAGQVIIEVRPEQNQDDAPASEPSDG